MVVMDVLEDTLGLGEMAGMLVGGILLIVLGLGHAVMPATSVVGGLLSMIDGVTVANSFSNVPGLVTRFVGVFVALLGYDITKDSLM